MELPKIQAKCSTYKYCYIIREVGEDDICYHKVGLARDIRARMAALQNANGRRLVLVSLFRPATHVASMAFEKKVLAKFADRRQCGEWLFGPLSETVAFAHAVRKPMLAVVAPAIEAA